MEDLIASYPGDFFTGKHLELVERQKTIPDVDNFNIFFRDEVGGDIFIKIIERPAQYSDTAKFSHYKKKLAQFGYQKVDVWLISPQISTAIKQAFDLLKINSFEISDRKFQNVVAYHNHKFQNEEKKPVLNEEHDVHDTSCGEKIPPRFKKEFKNRLKILRDTFPAAYSFLNYPIENRYSTDISLTTDVNAHLHFGKYFLVYIYIITNDNIIEFIPHPNNDNLPAGAVDGHPFLFSGIIPPLIAEFNGKREGWVQQDRYHGKYTFTNKTPESFFDSLIFAIENLDCKEMARKYPWFNRTSISGIE